MPAKKAVKKVTVKNAKKSNPLSLTDNKYLVIMLMVCSLIPVAMIMQVFFRNFKSIAQTTMPEVFLLEDGTSPVLAVDPITHELYDMKIDSEIVLYKNPNTGLLYLTETTFNVSGERVNGISKLYGSFHRNQNNAYYPNQFKNQFSFAYNPTGYPRFKSEKIIVAGNNCIDLFSDESRTKASYVATFCLKQTQAEPGKQFIIYSSNAATSLRGQYSGTKITMLQSLSTAFNKYDYGRTEEVLYGGNTKVNYFTIDTTNSSTSDFTNVVYSIDARGIDQNNTKDFAEWCYNYPNPPQIYLKQSWEPRPEGGSNYVVSRRNSGGCGYEIDARYLLVGYISLYKDGYTYAAPFPTVFPYPAPVGATPTVKPMPTPTPIIRPVPSPTAVFKAVPIKKLKPTVRPRPLVTIRPYVNR